MQAEWLLSLRDQWHRARVPFFFKQWGGTQKGRAGRTLAGQTYDEFPDLYAIQPPENAIRLQHLRDVEQVRLKFA
jgi:hypothetical protein